MDRKPARQQDDLNGNGRPRFATTIPEERKQDARENI